MFTRGLLDDRRIWSATAVVDKKHHKLLQEVHTSFLDAGADYVTCNNYGVTPGVGFTDEEIERYTKVAGRVAREACDRWVMASTDAKRRKPKVCGSLPPLLESYRADRVLDFDNGVRVYALIAQTLMPFVDCYLAETLSSSNEAKMALLGVQHGQSGDGDAITKVMVSFTLNSNGHLRSGENVCDAAEELLSFIASLANTKLEAILFNCSQPEAISKALYELNRCARAKLRARGVHLGAYANRLTIIPDDWALSEFSEPQAIRTDLAVEKYNDFVMQWVELGADIVGGCCGIGPEYIASIHQMLLKQGRR